MTCTATTNPAPPRSHHALVPKTPPSHLQHPLLPPSPSPMLPGAILPMPTGTGVRCSIAESTGVFTPVHLAHKQMCLTTDLQNLSQHRDSFASSRLSLDCAVTQVCSCKNYWLQFSSVEIATPLGKYCSIIYLYSIHSFIAFLPMYL